MSFEDYISEEDFEDEFEEEIEEACRYGTIRESVGLGRASYVGSQPPNERSRMALHYASEPSHGQSDLQPTNRGGGYGTSSDPESLARQSGGIRAEDGRGDPDARLPSGASNAHGPGTPIIGDRRGAPEPPDLRRVSRDRRLGRIVAFFGGSSRRHGSRQDPHSQARNVGHASHGGSTDRHSGQNHSANDRQS